MKIKTILLRTIILIYALLLTSGNFLAQESPVEFTPGPSVIKSINSEYHPNVVGISEDGIIQGINSMRDFLLKFYQDEGARSVAEEPFRISVNKQIDYEIGVFKTEKGTHYANIGIWVKKNGLEQRIMEVVYQMSEFEASPATTEIETARRKWVALCNAHDAGKLVTELYTEDAIYYNRGRVLIGREKLSAEYSYMNNPSYSLDLTPSHLLKVTEEMVFELGMCSGSYNLPYLLIWKKEADGNWRISFDSNY